MLAGMQCLVGQMSHSQAMRRLRLIPNDDVGLKALVCGPQNTDLGALLVLAPMQTGKAGLI